MQGHGKNAIFEIEPMQNDYDDEIWKPFPLEPTYLVSNYGRVKNPQGGILEGTINKGYVRTRIKRLGQLPNHRMVMLTFNPIENYELLTVDHINGIRDDNRLENLRWCSMEENTMAMMVNRAELNKELTRIINVLGYEETLR